MEWKNNQVPRELMLLILALTAIENISSEAENSFCDQLWLIPNPLYPIKLFFNLILVKKERKLLEQISRSHIHVVLSE